MAKQTSSLPLMLPPRPPRTPRVRWLYDALREAILEGRLAPGARLPATRDLAAQHGLSRGVVVQVFEELRAEGYVESRVGAGTFVGRLVPNRLLEAGRNARAAPAAAKRGSPAALPDPGPPVPARRRHQPSPSSRAAAARRRRGRMRAAYAERLSVLLERAGERLAPCLEIPRVAAGLQTVGWLADGLVGEEVVRAAGERQVEVVELSRYAQRPLAREGLLLGFAAVAPPELRRGVDELATVLERQREAT